MLYLSTNFHQLTMLLDRHSPNNTNQIIYTKADTDGWGRDCGATYSYVAQSTLYDYRGIDGTGTKENPVKDKTSSNYVEYKVRRLADGNCWTSENLKLTLSTSHSYEVANFDGTTTSWMPNRTATTNAYDYAITPNTKANDSATGEWYYPWYAATAGQGTNTTSPTINRSICPKGWRLPNGGSNPTPSFQSLATTYSIGSNPTGSAKLQGLPLSFYYAGRYDSGSLNSTSRGYYWSASPYTSDNNNAYVLRLLSEDVNPQNYNNKYCGFSVRCVAMP